ncbi:MAG: Uridylate kinase [Francisellaceae bacterium]|nr:Uridylate kinase [Francisellaceae bacterium]
MKDHKALPIYNRVLLKLSGEALMGDQAFGIDPKVLDRMAKEMGELIAKKVQIGMVVGGGNMFRGSTLSQAGIGRITADHMGMLATVMNALAMRDALERAGLATRIMSAIPMSGMVDYYDRRKAMHHLNHGRVVIFAAGTGNPLVTTDSAASLRALEINADILLKATNVDGIYTSDPAHNPDAVRYQRLTYTEALQKELGVMDLSAFCQCRDHNLKIRVFNLKKPGALLRVIMGSDEGTLVDKGE